MKNIYVHKWFPRFFYKKCDGGPNSGVTGYFLLEWKKVFSVGILHFKTGSREAFHSHAFNAVTFWLKGSVTEKHHPTKEERGFLPGLKPKYTRRACFHKVIAHKDTWALTFRGPWEDTWKEFRSDEYITLTHGRVEINRKARV